MTTHHRHKPFSLLALLVLALSCQSNAFSLPSLTPKHALRRKEPTKAPGRIFDNRRQGDHHAIQASLTGSLSGGGEQESLVTNVLSFVQKNFLLVGMIVAVSFARLYPAVRQLEPYYCTVGSNKHLAHPPRHSSERTEAS